MTFVSLNKEDKKKTLKGFSEQFSTTFIYSEEGGFLKSNYLLII